MEINEGWNCQALQYHINTIQIKFLKIVQVFQIHIIALWEEQTAI